MYIEKIKTELEQSSIVLNKFMNNDTNLLLVEEAALVVANAFKSKKKVLSCGNGGSHCDAMHFAEELTGRYRENRSAYPAIAISDVSHISCVANDFGYNYIFSRYIEGIGQEGDVLVCFSGSGNSINIIEAMKAAKEKGLKIIALTGNDGGLMSSYADIEIRIPHHGYADRIQEIHIKIIHILIMLIELEISK